MQKNVAFLVRTSEPTENNYKTEATENKWKVKLIYKKLWMDEHRLRKKQIDNSL